MSDSEDGPTPMEVDGDSDDNDDFSFDGDLDEDMSPREAYPRKDRFQAKAEEEGMIADEDNINSISNLPAGRVVDCSSTPRSSSSGRITSDPYMHNFEEEEETEEELMASLIKDDEEDDDDINSSSLIKDEGEGEEECDFALDEEGEDEDDEGDERDEEGDRQPRHMQFPTVSSSSSSQRGRSDPFIEPTAKKKRLKTLDRFEYALRAEAEALGEDMNEEEDSRQSTARKIVFVNASVDDDEDDKPGAQPVQKKPVDEKGENACNNIHQQPQSSGSPSKNEINLSTEQMKILELEEAEEEENQAGQGKGQRKEARKESTNTVIAHTAPNPVKTTRPLVKQESERDSKKMKTDPITTTTPAAAAAAANSNSSSRSNSSSTASMGSTAAVGGGGNERAAGTASRTANDMGEGISYDNNESYDPTEFVFAENVFPDAECLPPEIENVSLQVEGLEAPVEVRVLVPSLLSGGSVRLAHDAKNPAADKPCCKRLSLGKCLLVRRTREPLSEKVINATKANAAAVIIITDDRPVDAFSVFTPSKTGQMAPPLGAYLCSREDGDAMISKFTRGNTPSVSSFVLDRDRPFSRRFQPPCHIPRLFCPFCPSETRKKHTICSCPERARYVLLEPVGAVGDTTGPLEVKDYGPFQVIRCNDQAHAKDVSGRLYPLAALVPEIPWPTFENLILPPTPKGNEKLVRSTEMSKIHDTIYVGPGRTAGDREALRKNGIRAVFDCASQYNTRYNVAAVCKELGIEYYGIAALDAPNYPLLQHYDVFHKHMSRWKRHVLIVCAEGVNRSCTLTACYFVARLGWPLIPIIRRLRRERIVALTNPHFRYLLWYFAFSRGLPLYNKTNTKSIPHAPVKEWSRDDILGTSAELQRLGAEMCPKLLNALRSQAPKDETKANTYKQRLLYCIHESIMSEGRSSSFREVLFRLVISWRLPEDMVRPISDIWRKAKIISEKLLRKAPKPLPTKMEVIIEEDSAELTAEDVAEEERRKAAERRKLIILTEVNDKVEKEEVTGNTEMFEKIEGKEIDSLIHKNYLSADDCDAEIELDTEDAEENDDGEEPDRDEEPNPTEKIGAVELEKPLNNIIITTPHLTENIIKKEPCEELEENTERTKEDIPERTKEEMSKKEVVVVSVGVKEEPGLSSIVSGVKEDLVPEIPESKKASENDIAEKIVSSAEPEEGIAEDTKAKQLEDSAEENKREDDAEEEEE